MSAQRLRAFTLVELLTVIAILSVLAALLFPVFSTAREQARSSACLSGMRQIGGAVHLYLQDFDDTYPMSRFPDASHPLTGCLSPTTSHPVDGLQGSSRNWKRAIEAYIRNLAVFQCASNGNAWDVGGYNEAAGDETNRFWPSEQRLANSYAMNGSFFHEAVPACWYGERWERPRRVAEIERPSELILLLESRYSYPDLGGWYIPQRGPRGGAQGPFTAHNGRCNWLCADQHAKALKPQATCERRMWTDQYLDRAGGCERVGEVAVEYL